MGVVGAASDRTNNKCLLKQTAVSGSGNRSVAFESARTLIEQETVDAGRHASFPGALVQSGGGKRKGRMPE